MILPQYIATVWQTMSVSQVTQPVVNMETECREFDRITTLTQRENSPLTKDPFFKVNTLIWTQIYIFMIF